jgi:taurine dioxygenase
MKLQPLSPALGVQLLDFDIKRPATEAEQAELRRLFCQHHLLLVRGQDATTDDQDRFTQYFGPLSLMKKGVSAGHISNKPELKEIVVTGQNRLLWHADGTYAVHPGIGTSLLAIDAVTETTPTMYANCVRALKLLPNALRERIEGLTAIHYRETYTEQTNKRMRKEELVAGAPPDRYRSYEHPIIWPLPHTDQHVIFVNELATSHIVGLSPEDSEALIEELFTHMYAEDNIYTHHWQIGDLVIWDNLALQHCRPADLGTAPRHLRRLSLDGWNTGHDVLSWAAAGTVRENAELDG